MILGYKKVKKSVVCVTAKITSTISLSNVSFAILFLMLRQKFISKRLFALILPLAFIWGWAGCVVFCAENTAKDNHSESTQTIEQNGVCCLDINEKADDCTITATAVVLQERQLVKTPLLFDNIAPLVSFHSPVSARSAPLPEINQNSPPKIKSPPLFVRLCTFRI